MNILQVPMSLWHHHIAFLLRCRATFAGALTSFKPVVVANCSRKMVLVVSDGIATQFFFLPGIGVKNQRSMISRLCGGQQSSYATCNILGNVASTVNNKSSVHELIYCCFVRF